MCNIIACVTDGAPAMVDRHRGFISYLKNAVPEVLAVHCVVHREHFVAKHLSDRLHNSLNIPYYRKLTRHEINATEINAP